MTAVVTIDGVEESSDFLIALLPCYLSAGSEPNINCLHSSQLSPPLNSAVPPKQGKTQQILQASIKSTNPSLPFVGVNFIFQMIRFGIERLCVDKNILTKAGK